MSIVIRRAQPGDEAIIVDLLRELAEYERLSEKFRLTPEHVTRDFFRPAPVVRCDLAFVGAEPAGIITWYRTYVTFEPAHGIYLEDCYVRQSLRGQGVGRALLGNLATCAVADGATKIEWAVLVWNKPSIEFYENLHAERLNDWYIYRLFGDALTALARP